MSNTPSNIKQLRAAQQARLSSSIDQLKRAEQKTTNTQKSMMSHGIAAMRRNIKAQEQILHQGLSWDTLENLYTSIANGIIEFALAIRDNHAAIKACGRENAAINAVIITAINDCTHYSTSVSDIRKQHLNRSGNLTGPEDLDLYYSLGERYYDAYQRFQTLALHASTEITTAMVGIFNENNPNQDLQTLVENTVKNSDKG